MLEKVSWFRLTGLITGAIDVKMDGCVPEKKSCLKMLGLSFCSKSDWGSSSISIAKTSSKKIGALTRSMKFVSPEVALYLCIYHMAMYGLLLLVAT